MYWLIDLLVVNVKSKYGCERRRRVGPGEATGIKMKT